MTHEAAKPAPSADLPDTWLAEACAQLGVDANLVTALTTPLLDLVREVAHGISRPAAPLTAFVVGLSLAVATTESAATGSAPTDSATADPTTASRPDLQRLQENLERVRELVRRRVEATSAQPGSALAD